MTFYFSLVACELMGLTGYNVKCWCSTVLAAGVLSSSNIHQVRWSKCYLAVVCGLLGIQFTKPT